MTRWPFCRLRANAVAYPHEIKIEEREFTFTSAAPLHAWRLFRVSMCEDGYLLSSPMYHDPDPTPWPHVASTAVCYEDHAAPAPGCRCGIYAVIPGVLDSLPGYLLDTAHSNDPWAYAEIACSGRVFVDKRGIRAERAGVLSIALARSCWPDDATLADAKQLLYDRYRVPISGLETVPDWVIGNLRAEGPPPDEAAFDLDTLDLHV